MNLTPSTGRPIARVLALLAAALVFTTAAVSAQTRDLGAASLSDLLGLEVQRVFGASERLQPVTEAPSAVSIVTAEEIRRYGYRSLAEILQGVRGFYVTNDRNYSYVGVRGFGRPGDYNTRVLLLVNGHRVNDNVYDQAPVGTELDLDVAVIERVEIIRGPASSLYGTSAFFGVINIITRTGADLSGTVVEAGLGNLGTRHLRAVTGGLLANGVDYLLGTSFERSDGVEALFFPAFADSPSGGFAQGLDGHRIATFHGRINAGPVTITGGSGVRHKDVPTAAFDTMFNAQEPHFDTDDDRTFISAQLERGVGGTRIAISAAFNRYHYKGRYPYTGADGLVGEAYVDGTDGRRLTFAARATRALPGRHTVSGGVELVDNMRQDQWARGPEPGDDFDLPRSSREGAVFGQHEWAYQSWLRVIGGLRFDDKGRYHRVTPRAAVIVGQSSTQVVKYLYGRAFRAPNVYELYYWGDSSGDLSPETIDTHELVWERYTGEWLRTSLAAYRYDAENVLALEALGPGLDSDYRYFNSGGATAHGLEAEAELKLKRGIHAFAAYALQRGRDQDGAVMSNSPASLLTLRGSLGAPATGRFASIELVHLGERRTIADRTLSAATLVNATASMPVTKELSAVLSARNLFDARYEDPASDEHAMDAIEQNGRTIRFDLRLTIGGR